MGGIAFGFGAADRSSAGLAGLGVGAFAFFSGIINGGGIALRSGDRASLRAGGLGSDAVAEGLLPVRGFFGVGVTDGPEVFAEASRRDLISSSVGCVLECVSSFRAFRAGGVGVSARVAALPLRWSGGRSRDRLRGP